ncbi:MAG: hypothetical protein ACRBFS_22455 [Aureispira sp.]
MHKIECRAAEAFIYPHGIIEVHIKSSWDQPDTPETSSEIAIMLKEYIDSSHVPYALMLFPPNLYVKKEVLQAYFNIKIGHIADALVVNSFGARLIGKIVLGFHKNPTPIKIFSNKADAEVWLLEQLELTKNK